MRALVLACRRLSSCFVFTWPSFSVCVWREREWEFPGISSYNDTNTIGQEPTLMISINCNYFFRGSITQYSNAEFRDSTYEFEGDTNIQFIHWPPRNFLRKFWILFTIWFIHIQTHLMDWLSPDWLEGNSTVHLRENSKEGEGRMRLTQKAKSSNRNYERGVTSHCATHHQGYHSHHNLCKWHSMEFFVVQNL